MTATVVDSRARLIVAGPDLAEHVRRHGPVPWQGGPHRLIPLVEAAGLTGHGGAGFPTHRKLAAVAAGDRPVVVGNGAEGEPASAKDRTLLHHAPHLVLDGLQLAAECVGASRAYLYVQQAPAEAVRHALAQRRAARQDRIAVEVVVAADRFVSGEESAVVSAVEGRAPLPRDKFRMVVKSGVRGRPTLVQNVETLAHLALIARHGPTWFRSRGTAEEPGTFLATVNGAVGAPGVYELPYGVPVEEALARAGGTPVPLQALLVGGFHGAWLPPEAFGAPLSRAGLRPWGAVPGAGVLVALPLGRCGLIESARIAGYLAGETAGQCGPCVNGLPRLATTLHRLAHGPLHPALPAEVARLSALVERRGACNHPDGTVRFIRSSMQIFAAEVTAHLAGRCSQHGRGTR
ncbi:MAG: NADH-quinone oxidoreductase subunit F [Actinobacteria bacterium]|nr:MAG: NADH-quinone oxidoreductase subunit F [Actinomycetota bacterium]